MPPLRPSHPPGSSSTLAAPNPCVSSPWTIPTPTPVLGWAAAGFVSDRRAYAGVVEHSVYVRPDAHGRGCGRLLLDALIERCEAQGVWTVQSGIFPENTASLALHERCGFRFVGRRERIGCHHGRWRDVLFIERRSTTTGVS